MIDKILLGLILILTLALVGVGLYADYEHHRADKEQKNVVACESATSKAKADAEKDAADRTKAYEAAMVAAGANHEKELADLDARRRADLARLRADQVRRDALRPAEARPTQCLGFAATPSELRRADADDLAALAADANSAVLERNLAVDQLAALWTSCRHK
jgi:hypothetical protein